MSNLKFAVRTLATTPFVTLVAIVSLALGIGANAAIFSLFNQLLLRPLPVPSPSQLVNLVAPGPKPGNQSCGIASTRDNCDDVFSYPMFRDLEKVHAPMIDLEVRPEGQARRSDLEVRPEGQTWRSDLEVRVEGLTKRSDQEVGVS
jgi:hypothetical protein